MTKFRKVAIEAATKAGKLLLKNYKTLKAEDIHKKGRHDLVTKADFAANKIIISTIKKYFPDHDILSEETGFEDNPDQYKWVIDPLDGTTNYIIKNPIFCTALALVHKQEIIVSAVYAPVLDEFYIAEKGKGTLLNGKKIRVSKKRKLKEAIITLSRTHHKKSHENHNKIQSILRKKVLNMRIFGSGTLDLAYVAAGRVEGCLFFPPGIFQWDSLSGILLVREAGGIVTTFKGKKWGFKDSGIIATNKGVHSKFLKEIKRWKV